MKTVGQILKEERAKKNLSLEDIERNTKIRKKTLEDLENGNWKSLPSNPFVKGLIKNYGSYLGLNVNSLVAFYRREFDERKSSSKTHPQQLKKPIFRLTPQIVVGLVIAILVVGVSAYLFTQYRSLTAAPLLEIEEPKDNIKVTTSEVNVVGRTWPDAILKINGQDIELSPGGTFSVAVNLNPGANVITISSANRFGKITTKNRTVMVETSTEFGDGEATASAEKANKLEILVKIGPGSANLRVEIDGNRSFEGVLLAGVSRKFEGKKKIKITTSNGGSTRVLTDSKEELLGGEGEKVQKEYTR